MRALFTQIRIWGNISISFKTDASLERINKLNMDRFCQRKSGNFFYRTLNAIPILIIDYFSDRLTRIV